MTINPVADMLITAGEFFVIITLELVLLFIAVSFLVGILHAYVPEEKIKKTLSGKRNVSSTFLGGIFGALTPFCSCSTIPILVGLLNAGVPFTASMAFLLASPLLNPVIIFLLLALIGPAMTILYTAVTFAAILVIATLLGRLGYEQYVKEVTVEGMKAEPACECTSESFSGRHKPRLKQAYDFAISLFRQVFFYLILGAGIGAFIYGFIPADLITAVAGPENPFAILVAAVIGIPMYIRAETIIPISAVLLSKGMGTGAVVALIIGGAGASIPEITLLASIFKKRLVAAFVISVLGVAISAGIIFQALAGIV
jgi:uncharacterized membrane protein YraQ (UPF0718 family)